MITTYLGAKVLIALSGYLLKRSASSAGRSATNELYRKITGKDRDLFKSTATGEEIQEIHSRIDHIEIDINALTQEIKNLNSLHADRDFFKLIDEIEIILQSNQNLLNFEIELPNKYISMIDQITTQQIIQEDLVENLEVAQEYLIAMINNLELRIKGLEIDHGITREQINENIMRFAELELERVEKNLQLNYNDTYELAKKRVTFLLNHIDSLKKNSNAMIQEIKNIQALISPLGLDLVLIIDQPFQKKLQLFLNSLSDAELHYVFRTNPSHSISFNLSDEVIYDN